MDSSKMKRRSLLRDNNTSSNNDNKNDLGNINSTGGMTTTMETTTTTNEKKNNGFHLHIMLSFMMGIIVGNIILPKIMTYHHNGHGQPSSASSNMMISGSIQRLNEIPYRNTSHRDEYGKPIIKQQLLEPFAVPYVTGFSIATISSRQRVQIHQHESMHEFFYVLEGSGIFYVGERGNRVQEGRRLNDPANGIIKNETVTPGTFLHFAPHEDHGIFVPSSHGDGDIDDDDGNELKVLIVGIIVD